MKTKRLAATAMAILGPLLGTAYGQSHTSPNRWTGTWATAPVDQLADDEPAGDLTYREIVHVSQGGSHVRVVLSNEFGTTPLTIQATHVALSAGQSQIDTNSDRALTFSGKPEATIPAGALLVSDPAPLSLPPLADLAVSVFVPSQKMPDLSVHLRAMQENYAVSGDHATAASLPTAKVITTYPIVRTVEVLPSAATAVIARLGDSLTDGVHSTMNANARWPNVLAARLVDLFGTSAPGVLDLGIGGNRLRETGNGPAALARLDRDVLSQSNLKYLVVLEGINDIGDGWKQGSTDPHPPTAQDIIAAYQQIITRAHARNVAVAGATLLPYQGAGYYSSAGEAVREQVNAWIREEGHFDAVFDFEKAVQDPSAPLKLSPAYDSGDHLHPNDDGYQAIANSIPLSVFSPAR